MQATTLLTFLILLSTLVITFSDINIHSGDRIKGVSTPRQCANYFFFYEGDAIYDVSTPYAGNG